MNATGGKRITQLRRCLEPSRPTSSAEGGYSHSFDVNLMEGGCSAPNVFVVAQHGHVDGGKSRGRIRWRINSNSEQSCKHV